jgi:hypothetical protein
MKPKYIIIHHSVTPQSWEHNKTIQNINNSHYARFVAGRAIKMQSSLDQTIAYHWVISGDGTSEKTREENVIGWHSGSWLYNMQSLGICLAGNFDKNKITNGQKKTLGLLLKNLIKKYNIPIDNILFHRDVKATSCPGKNITKELVRELLYSELIPQWARENWEKAKKLKIIGGDPLRDFTALEWQWVFKKTGVINDIGSMPAYRVATILKKLDLI